MPVFTLKEERLASVLDGDGEVWLKGKDVAGILMSTKLIGQELNKWILDEVLPLTMESKDSSLEEAELFQKLNEDIHHKNEELMLKDKLISKLRLSLRELQRQLFEMELKAVPDTIDRHKGNVFFLIKKNIDVAEDDMGDFRFYALRIQKRSVEESLNKLKARYPNHEVLYSAEDPNAVNLFNRLRELKNVSTCENHLDTSLADEELVEMIKNLHKNKLNKSTGSNEIESEKNEEKCSRMTGNTCNH